MREAPLRFGILAASCIVSLVVTNATVEQANASLLAYEGFAYSPGISLNEQNGGTGFSDAWFVDEYDYSVTSGNLLNASNSPPSSGNSLQHTGLQPRARRNLEPLLGMTGTTIYISFLLRQDAVGDFTQADHDWGGIILGGINYPDIFGIDGLYIGRGAYGPLSDKYVLGPAGNANQETSSGVPVSIGETAFLAVRVDFHDGADKATLFVNPVPGSPELIGDTVLNIDLGIFSQLAITQGNNSVWSIDEIRVATTWQGVTIPEPTAIVLWSVAGIILLDCRWAASRYGRKRPHVV